MRSNRLLDLHLGGIRRKEFQRRTFLRVRVPYLALYALLIYVSADLLPRRLFGRRSPEWIMIGTFVILGPVLMAVNKILITRNERHRPKDLQRFCPRCGYDVSATPDRCPECGMRHLYPAKRREPPNDNPFAP
jgi:hypothetical protein